MSKFTLKNVILDLPGGLLDAFLDATKWVLIITLALLLTANLLVNKFSEKKVIHPESFQVEPLKVKTYKC